MRSGALIPVDRARVTFRVSRPTARAPAKLKGTMASASRSAWLWAPAFSASEFSMRPTIC